MLRKTQIFAHRGANRQAAENTRAAFDLALHHDISGIETDVQLSRDAVPVLWHDDDLGRLGLPSQHIDDLDYAALLTIDFSRLCSSNAGFSNVMRLQDFISHYRDRARLLLEIKNRQDEPVTRVQLKVRQTLASVGAHNGEEVLISSFHLDSLIYAHQCAPSFPLIYNMEPEQTLENARTVLSEQPYLHGFCLPISRLDHAMVDMLRSHNKTIAVYTCNSAAEIQQALDLTVDILISDVPEFALQLRDHTASPN
jgi:glycerophosphoryl diester phosphodiesterase